MDKDKQIVVIGGGASGMMAAAAAAQAGGRVLLLERNAKPGRKLYITGKGRCNLTNDCSPREVLENVVSNSRFLTGVIYRTPPEIIMETFRQMGVSLKTERGRRVFPQSDKASDVIDALVAQMRRLGVMITQERVVSLRTDEIGRLCCVCGERKNYPCHAAILATGGASYPLTGSTGDGYVIAASMGHKVTPLRPSLVPLEVEEAFCAEMQGLSLRNVGLAVHNENGKKVYQGQGELLFTHFGLSGPLVLTASAYLRDFDTQRYRADIDLKPALDEQMLDARLVRELSQHSQQDFRTILRLLVPRSMIPVILALTDIPGDIKGNAVSKKQRRKLLETLKRFPLHILRPRSMEEAIITAGGVDVREIDPKTMMSKCVPGLFFAGEIMDVDALTGGFNLQIAWASGIAAGIGAADFCNAN